MQKIEDYINQLDTAGINVNPIDHDALVTLGALLKDKPHIAGTMRQHALAGMTMGILRTQPQLADAIEALNDAALEIAYIETVRAKYGNEYVNECLELARTSPRSFYHIVTTRELSASFKSTMNAITEAFASTAQEITKRLNDVLNTEDNRHSRRSAKHARRIDESYQQWVRRNKRKFRR